VLPFDGSGYFFGSAIGQGRSCTGQIPEPFDHAVAAAFQRFHALPRSRVLHMLTFMAGASSTGPVKARYNVERKSPARP